MYISYSYHSINHLRYELEKLFLHDTLPLTFGDHLQKYASAQDGCAYILCCAMHSQCTNSYRCDYKLHTVSSLVYNCSMLVIL